MTIRFTPKWVAFAAFLLLSPTVVIRAQQPQPAAADAKPNYDVPIHGHGRYVPSPDGRIYYEIEGRGPAVFLVAGGPGGSHASYHPFFSRLAADHTVVYFDNIGRGRSDRLRDPRKYTVRRDAEDIEALRRALGFGKITVIGHSYGGMPALAYAIAYPQHVDHLVLSDTLLNAHAFQENIDNCNREAAMRFPDVWASLTAMRKSGVKTGSDQYENLYGATVGDLYWYDPDHEGLMFASRDAADAFNPDVYQAMIGDDPEWKVGGTMKGYDPSRVTKVRLAGIPVLVIAGRFDRVSAPALAMEIKDALPDATSQIRFFARSGHRPWVEETDRYFAVVRAFLANKPVPATETPVR